MLKEKTPQPHTGFAGYGTIPCSPCSHPPSFTLLHTLSYRATNMIPMMCCRICNYSSTDTTSQTTLINVRLHRANCRSALHMLLIPLKGPCVNGFMSRGHCTLLTCWTSQPFESRTRSIGVCLFSISKQKILYTSLSYHGIKGTHLATYRVCCHREMLAFLTTAFFFPHTMLTRYSSISLQLN